MNIPSSPKVLPPLRPLRLESPGKTRAPWTYPVIGFLLGTTAGILVGHPLAMMVFNFQQYVHGQAALDLWPRLLLSFAPQMWPMMTLFGLSGGVFGAILGQVFGKLKQHQRQVETLYKEFELQVASLRHHYKNLAIGIEGFSGRVSRKVTKLAQQIRQRHGENCPQEDCFCHTLPALEKDVGILTDTAKRLSQTLGRELIFLKALTSNQAAPTPQDIYPVLAAAIRDLLEARFRDKKIQVEINGRPLAETQAPLLFKFELMTMEVILKNILSNAMKYGDHIQVNLMERETDIQIAILDNGPGFDVEDLRNQLLVPRKQLELGSTQLGLWVTLHLMEKCGGRLLVASQPGRGTNFTLEFPK